MNDEVLGVDDGEDVDKEEVGAVDPDFLESMVENAGESAGEGAGEDGVVIDTALIVKPVVELLLSQFCPNWDIKDGEVMMLSGSVSAILDKYFPDLDFGCELQFIMVVGVIFGPRYASNEPRILRDVDVSKDEKKGLFRR